LRRHAGGCDLDKIRNPFQPGAGNRPPELAGRDEVIDRAMTALKRVASGKTVPSMVLVGLRGVGKTVVLKSLQKQAKEQGFQIVVAEGGEGKSLEEMLMPGVRQALLALSLLEAAREKARQALGALSSFLGRVGLSISGVDITFNTTLGIADSGDLEADLADLLVQVGEAALAAKKCVVLFVDEMQSLDRKELTALIAAMHRISQEGLPVALIGAALPQILSLSGDAKSYSERLFVFPEIGALSDIDAAAAIVNPAAAEGVKFEPDAVTEILRVTQHYPYFLQQWAHDAWNVAEEEHTVTWSNVIDASDTARETLDESFFRMRFDRCNQNERLYMRALAELGPGVHRTAEIVAQLGCETDKGSQLRYSLIKKGMIYSPKIGEVCFTVPMFDEFMRRAVPEFVPKA